MFLNIINHFPVNNSLKRAKLDRYIIRNRIIIFNEQDITDIRLTFLVVETNPNQSRIFFHRTLFISRF